MHDTLVQGCVGAFSMLDAAESLQDQSRQRAQELVGRAREQIRTTIGKVVKDDHAAAKRFKYLVDKTLSADEDDELRQDESA